LRGLLGGSESHKKNVDGIHARRVCINGRHALKNMPRNPQRPQAFFAFTGYWWLNVNVGRSGIISGQGRCWGWERDLPVCGEGGSLG